MALRKTVRRGNKTTFTIGLKQNSVLMENLADATQITFAMYKDDEADNPNVLESVWTGEGTNPNFVVDSPATGQIQVTFDSDEMTIDEGVFTIVVQAEWAPTDKLEWELPSVIQIVQDRIP